ncbi:MAG: ABC transporter substrate-binding protein [Fimbriimonadaceae bacterium]
MTRRLLQMALALGAASAVYCGPNADPGKTHIRYMAWGNPEQLGVEQQLCDAFNRENPDVHVTLLRVPGSAYRSKAVVMLATDTAPDVLRIDHYDFPSFQEKAYFRDLTPFVAKDRGFHTADFWPQAIDEGTVRGRLFGLNVLFGGILIYYNQSLVERAGLEDPYALYRRGAWTWDAFRRYAIAMSRPASGEMPETFGALIPTSVSVVAPIIWGYGGHLLSPDHKRCLMDRPQAVAALKFLADLRNVDHAAPTVSESANSAYPFEGGKIGMTFDFMGMTPRYRAVIKDFKWDVVPIPRGPAGGASLVKGNQLVMAACTRHAQAAWRFMRFITSTASENLLYVRLRRCFPTRIAVATSGAYLRTDASPFHMQAFVDAVKTGRPLPIDDRWAEWTTVVQAHLDELFDDPKANAAAELALAAHDADKVLAEEPGW